MQEKQPPDKLAFAAKVVHASLSTPDILFTPYHQLQEENIANKESEIRSLYAFLSWNII